MQSPDSQEPNLISYRPSNLDECILFMNHPVPICSLKAPEQAFISLTRSAVIIANIAHVNYPDVFCQVQIVVSLYEDQKVFFLHYSHLDEGEHIPTELAERMFYEHVAPFLGPFIEEGREILASWN